MATDTQFSEIAESAGTPGPPHRPPGQPADDDEISLLDLLIVLAEHKRMIAAVTATFAVVSVVASLILPKSYTAKAVLMPPRQESSLGSILTSQLGSLGSMAALAGSSLGIRNPNDMYVAMFRSQTVEDAVIRKFGLMKEYKCKYLSDARKAFEHHSKVEGNGKDNLIHVSVEDHDPQRAADLTNAYLEAFHHLTEHLAITEAGQRRLFFQQQLEEAKDNLTNAEEALKRTQQTTGLIQLNSQATALVESAANLRAQITGKEVQIAGLETFATGQNAQLMQAQQELDGLRAELAKLGGSEENPDSLIVPKGLVPQAGLEYLRKLRDVRYYETIFEILAKQFEIAKLDEAKEGSVIQIVDPAIKPDRRSFPQRALIVIGATFVGFILGVFAALTKAWWARLKADPDSNAKLALLKRTLAPGSRLTP